MFDLLTLARLANASDKTKKNEMGGACGSYGGRGGACTGFWRENLGERDHGGDPGADGRIILIWVFRKWDVGLWAGSSWLRIVAGGGHL